MLHEASLTRAISRNWIRQGENIAFTFIAIDTLIFRHIALEHSIHIKMYFQFVATRPNHEYREMNNWLLSISRDCILYFLEVNQIFGRVNCFIVCAHSIIHLIIYLHHTEFALTFAAEASITHHHVAPIYHIKSIECVLSTLFIHNHQYNQRRLHGFVVQVSGESICVWSLFCTLLSTHQLVVRYRRSVFMD